MPFLRNTCFSFWTFWFSWRGFQEYRPSLSHPGKKFGVTDFVDSASCRDKSLSEVHLLPKPYWCEYRLRIFSASTVEMLIVEEKTCFSWFEMARNRFL